jgi:hypothetical protein
MAITYTVDTKGQANAVSTTITSNTLTVAAGDYITVVAVYGDNADSTARTISNTGTAITWTLRGETTTASNCKVVLYDGVAGATPPTTVSVETTAGSGFSASKWLAVIAHTGAHATTPLPSGNIFTGAGGTDVSQAITPTSSGSALWFACGDWSATNTYAAAANCTLGTVYHESGYQTDVLIRPTTQPRTDANAFTIGETDTGGKIAWIAFEVQAASSSATLEQEGFAFGTDDGSESAHTLATQDANTTAQLGTKTLRVLVNATGDPASAAYTLRSQKNGAGGYVAVPTSATTTTAPVCEAGDCTESGNNTASTTWNVTYPAFVSGDLLVFHVASDADVTHNWPATGPNGETINTIYDSVGGTAQRASAFWFVGSATTATGSVAVTPSATEQWTGAVLKVLAGEFNASTPIQTNTGTANDTSADAAASTPSWTTDATAGGRAVVWFAIDAVQATAAPSGWTIIASEDRGATGGTLGVRTAATTASETIASADFTLATETDTSIGYVINGVVVTNQVYVSTSSNVTAGGEATTARLTAPSGKTTSNFTTGRRWDDENGTDSIDIASGNYTEVEWVLTTQGASNADYFDFRVYAGAAALDTYTLTPRWTITTVVTHPSTGALSAQSAVVSGAAARLALHGSTGALTSQAAATNGAATHSVAHTSVGALVAGAAAVVGSATHPHTSTGVLTAQGASVAGTAVRQHTSTGALVAGGATVAGTAAHTLLHTSTGALVTDGASVVGASATGQVSTGALVAGGSVVTGSAARLVLHATTGALSAQAAALAGTALHPHTSTGALATQAAMVAGAAVHPHTSTGALEAQAATIAGTSAHDGIGRAGDPAPLPHIGLLLAPTGAVSHDATGALAAQAATVVGSALHPHTSTGALVASAAAVAGSAQAPFLAQGAIAAAAATVAGSAARIALHTSIGVLAAQTAVVSGSALTQSVATGALAAQSASVSGAATHLTLHTSTGALSSGAATVSGDAASGKVASGALSAQQATASGVAARTRLHDSTGTLSAQSGTVTGTAAHHALHTSTGTLSADVATVAGAAASGKVASGALTAQAAVASGAAIRTHLHDATGAPSAGAAVVAGVATDAATFTSTGALLAGNATLTAAAVRAAPAHSATGSLSAQAAAVVGAATRFALHTSTGAAVSGSAQIAGSSSRFRVHTSEGAIAAGPASIAGDSAHTTELTATGALAAGSAAIAGVGAVISPRAFAVWDLVLENGLTAGVTLSTAHDKALEFWIEHGLQAGTPLVVTPTSTTAGAIELALENDGTQTTVQRV